MNPSPTHILLVEDDPAIATSLKIAFKREGWQMTWLDNASSVLPTLQHLSSTATVSNTPSLSAIILDVGLPDGDGLSLCQHIRHSSAIGDINDLPIVFLTARSEEVDRILGLEMGADDYCAKPFSPRELIARLKAIWRREQLASQTKPDTTASEEEQVFTLASGTWRYQPINYRVFWQNQRLTLAIPSASLSWHCSQHPTKSLVVSNY